MAAGMVGWPDWPIDEIAFDSDPYSTTPTWTDVSAYVRLSPSLQVSRGRDDPWSPCPAGRLTLTLSNRDRRFDPTYTAGPYYGKLTAGRQIRVRQLTSAVYYPLFYGFVLEWPQQTVDRGLDATVDIEAYDGIEALAAARLAGEVYADYVASLGSQELWLRQADRVWWVDSMYSGHQPVTVGSVSIAQDTLGVGVRSSPVVFDGATWFQIADPLVLGGSWTQTFWVQADPTPPTSTQYIAHWRSGAGDRSSTMLSTTGTIQYVAQKSAGGPFTVSIESSTIITDGFPHHVAIVYDGSAGQIFIDGIPDYNQVRSGSSAYTYRVARLGGDGYTEPGVTFTPPNTASILNGTQVQDFAVFSTNLTETQLATMYGLGIGYLEETTTDRITRHLDHAGWPATWRNLTTNPRGMCGEIGWTGEKAINACRDIEASEAGRLFIDNTGRLTLTTRYAHQETTRSMTVQARFSDDGNDFAYTTFGYVESATNVRNDITVQNETAEYRSQSTTSQTLYRRRSETITTVLSTVAQLRDLAKGLIYWWKDATLRVDAFEVSPPTPANFTTLFGLELGDLSRSNKPP